MWHCKSNREWVYHCASSAPGKSYAVHFRFQDHFSRMCYGYDCECKGYKYRSMCRHIREAIAVRCTWKGDTPTVDQKCPKCGNNVFQFEQGIEK